METFQFLAHVHARLADDFWMRRKCLPRNYNSSSCFYLRIAGLEVLCGIVVNLVVLGVVVWLLVGTVLKNQVHSWLFSRLVLNFSSKNILEFLKQEQSWISQTRTILNIFVKAGRILNFWDVRRKPFEIFMMRLAITCYS